MASRSRLPCILVTLLAVALRAEEGPAAIAGKVKAALAEAGTRLGVEFQEVEGSPGAFAGTLTQGLKTLKGIDLEVRVRDGSVVEVAASPRRRSGRLDATRAVDRPGLLARLATSPGAMAPYAWDTEPTGAIRAACEVRWSDPSAAGALERALLAAPALDGEAAALLAFLPPELTDAELKARLREAAENESRRGQVLASIAEYLPEARPSRTLGQSRFQKLTLNGLGASFDAFRFRAPPEPAEQRLVWAFAYPPGTAKGWYIAPVTGEAPKLVRFHSGKKYEGSGIPQGHATLLQRTESPLRGGAESIVWFQFKVETPVDMYVALGCFPFAASDRDGRPALEAALGLKEIR